MSRIVLLDSTPLGLIANSSKRHPIADWVDALVAAKTRIAIPEVADYEVRRELLRAGLSPSVIRLDELKLEHLYLPITTDAMLLAARFWAEGRQTGRPTAGSQRLDGDSILAAQAVLAGATGHEVIVATANVKHLSQFVDAREWQDIS